MKYCIILLVIVLSSPFISGAAYTQDVFHQYRHLLTPPNHYMAGKVEKPINIDGKLDESEWEHAAWSTNFVDIEGAKKKMPAFKTRFKILWDQQFLYVGVEIEEPHVWAKIQQNDAVIYFDNDIELFLDPDGDTHNYFEIELNANNKVFDLFMQRPYRNGGIALHNWDVKNLRSAVHVMGSLNKPEGLDTGWSVEMVIPFESISLGSKSQAPKDGSTWRINFSRVEWEVDIIDGKYVKRRDKQTGRSLPEQNWVWSPQGVINMHFPERWGYLHFTNEKPGERPPVFDSSSQQAINYLWVLYYQQKKYFSRHKKYASELPALPFPGNTTINGKELIITLEATRTQYIAMIRAGENGQGWQINHEGKINKI